MVPPPPPAAVGPAAGPARPQGLLQGIARMVMMWYMFKQLSGFMGGSKPGAGGVAVGGKGAAPPLVPKYYRSHPLDVHVYVSEQRRWRDAAAGEEPVWVAPNVALAGSGPPHTFTYAYRPSPVRRRRGAEEEEASLAPREPPRARLPACLPACLPVCS